MDRWRKFNLASACHGPTRGSWELVTKLTNADNKSANEAVSILKLNLVRLEDENQLKQKLQHLKQQKELALLLIEEQISLSMKNIANLKWNSWRDMSMCLLCSLWRNSSVWRLVSVYWQRSIKICMKLWAGIFASSRLKKFTLWVWVSLGGTSVTRIALQLV